MCACVYVCVCVYVRVCVSARVRQGSCRHLSRFFEDVFVL